MENVQKRSEMVIISNYNQSYQKQNSKEQEMRRTRTTNPLQPRRQCYLINIHIYTLYSLFSYINPRAKDVLNQAIIVSQIICPKILCTHNHHSLILLIHHTIIPFILPLLCQRNPLDLVSSPLTVCLVIN